jgi:hypothetical protein
MKLINHEFLYTCCHPTKENFVICLEKNIYPKDVEIFNLQTEETKPGKHHRSRQSVAEFTINPDDIKMVEKKE